MDNMHAVRLAEGQNKINNLSQSNTMGFNEAHSVKFETLPAHVEKILP